MLVTDEWSPCPDLNPRAFSILFFPHPIDVEEWESNWADTWQPAKANPPHHISHDLGVEGGKELEANFNTYLRANSRKTFFKIKIYELENDETYDLTINLKTRFSEGTNGFAVVHTQNTNTSRTIFCLYRLNEKR